jgi:hypothetical protein
MKSTSRRRRPNPSAAALREMPEVDFSRYRVGRNPYAARIAREGKELLHEGPTAASLREMPEIDFSRARMRRNPYVSRAAEAAGKIQYGRGRPRHGDEIGPTSVRSVRLPEMIWRVLEVEARGRDTTVHALLREVIVAYVRRLVRT